MRYTFHMYDDKIELWTNKQMCCTDFLGNSICHRCFFGSIRFYLCCQSSLVCLLLMRAIFFIWLVGWLLHECLEEIQIIYHICCRSCVRKWLFDVYLCSLPEYNIIFVCHSPPLPNSFSNSLFSFGIECDVSILHVFVNFQFCKQ